MNIVVQKITPVKQGGNLKALVEVALANGTTLRQCRIVEVPNQRPWVAMPTSEWVDAGGKRRFLALVTLPDNLQRAVSDAILAAWTVQKAALESHEAAIREEGSNHAGA